MKNQLLLVVFVIGLTSCTSTAAPSATSTFALALTETLFPTEFYTPIPTDTLTLTPTRIPTTATATTEPIPFTSFHDVFVMGVNSAGENIYGGTDYDLFHIFTAQPSEFALFRFTMQITAFHFIKNELTPTPTAIPTETWRILIYRYRTDGTYINQPVIKTNLATAITPLDDRLATSLSADVSMDELQIKFGDCSVFTFQFMDEQGKIRQQGYFSINPHLLFPSGGGLIGNINDGITLGFPYSLNEKEAEFFHQGKFVTIIEPKSSFYRLQYVFNFTDASGVPGTVEQEKLASELTIRLFSYKDDGNYAVHNSYPASGNLIHSAGYYQVNLPIDYLKEKANINDKYYLQVVDGKGKIIRDEYFLFIPYAP